MLPVSTDYLPAIRKRRHRVIRSRVEITWTDPQRDQSIRATANSQANICWLEHLHDGREEPSFKYAALDGTWQLDGTYHLAPDTKEAAFRYQMGWWSGKLSDANGEFSQPYPGVTLRFAPQSISGLRIVGDMKREEWLVDFDIYLYRNGQLIDIKSVTDNDVIVCEVDLSSLSLYDCDQIAIKVKKISHPGRHAKIIEMFTSLTEVYEGKDIAYLSVLEEREMSNDGSLPIGNITSNELILHLVDTNGRFNPGNVNSKYHNLLRLNRKIRAWIGPKLLDQDVVEYKPMGTFWVKSIEVVEDSHYVVFTAQDMLQLLSDTEYLCPVTYNTNLYDQAVAVLEDARIILNLPDDDFYWIDDELKNITVEWFWLEPMSHREALRKIVERAIGQCYVSRDNVVRIEGVSFIKIN